MRAGTLLQFRVPFDMFSCGAMVWKCNTSQALGCMMLFCVYTYGDSFEQKDVYLKRF